MALAMDSCMLEIRHLASPNPTPATGPPPPGPSPASSSRLTAIFGEDGLSFGDVLDLINPLQHIPVVGNLYRKLTGDALAPGIRIAGGALFGGPLGAVLSVGGLLMERQSAVPLEAAPETNAAFAEAGSAQRFRGGWIVNAAMSGIRSAEIPASARPADMMPVVTRSPAAPRGGWLVAQALGSDPAAAATGNLLRDKV